MIKIVSCMQNEVKKIIYVLSKMFYCVRIMYLRRPEIVLNASVNLVFRN